jgi:uncharacterized protein (TIGR00730 family)
MSTPKSGANPRRLFPTAKEDAHAAKKVADSAQCRSSAYRLAFQDPDFLLRDELRPIRLQLELLKPELVQVEKKIESTVVIFGSARIKEPEVAQQALTAIDARANKLPDDPDLEAALRKARHDARMSRLYGEARELGQLISSHTDEHKLVVITGGGPGIMEAANRGADDVGALSIGMNIVLPFEQDPNPYTTPELCFQFHYFAIRKMHLIMRAKCMVAFPGGFGTMDELFETLTLIQTKKIKPMPVLLFGQAFWNRVINFEALVEEGTISKSDLSIFRFVESAREAWDIIKYLN